MAVLIWSACAAASVLLTSLMLAALFPSYAHILTPSVLGVGLGSVLVGMSAALYAVVWRAPDELEIARIIQQQEPEFRHDLISALRFGQAFEQGTFDDTSASPELARLHIERAASRVEARQANGHLGTYLPKSDLRPGLWSLVGVMVTLLIPILFAPQWVMDTLSQSAEQVAQQAASLKGDAPETRPVMGNLSLRMQPPDYTGLAEQFELFSTGRADVLAGTYIAFDGFVLPVRATQVELVIKGNHIDDDADPEELDVRQVELYGDGRGRGGFVAQASLTYWFRATLDDGTLIEEGTPRQVSVAPDKVPGVSILSHEGEIEVGADDILDLNYVVQDDFGITEIARISVFAGSADEKRMLLDLPALQSTPLEHTGNLILDLSEFNLQPRDRISIMIEALDNNTLTGPGVGRSEAIELFISSPNDKHMKHIEAQREVVESLLMVLADYLEAPMGERVVDKKGTWSQRIPKELSGEARTERFKKLGGAHQNAGRVFEAMGQLVKVLKQDPLMVERDFTMFSSLHEQLQRLHNQGTRHLDRSKLAASQNQLAISEMVTLGAWSGETEEALEKGILRLEDLLFSQQAKNVEHTMEEVREIRERLKEMIKQYKDTKDPAVKEAIKREMQRLRARMQELAQSMQSQIKQMPAEHINREAIEQKKMENSANKVVEDFNTIEELLDKGDIDGALDALEKMGENLDGMQQMMDEQFEGAQPKALSEFDQKMSELIDDANDLNELQQKLEQDTSELQQAMQEERNDQITEQLAQLKKDLSEEITDQRKELEKMQDSALSPAVDEARKKALDAMKQVEQSLKQDDVEGSLEAAERSLDQLDAMRMQAQLSKRFQSRRRERAATEKLLQKSKQARQRGERISDELGQMMEQAGEQAERFDPRAEKLSKRQQKITKRAEEIQKKIEQAGEQYPGLKEQLDGPMKQSKESMQRAEKGLQRQRMQGALDAERQAIESLRQLKQSMKDSVQKERQRKEGDGSRPSSEEKVEIPGKSDRRRPAYRELLQDGMKEERLDEYESDIDRYYKSLGN